ncbi:MAG: DUF2272 domain-containing protein [Noviherbaspirillum sp.]
MRPIRLLVLLANLCCGGSALAQACAPGPAPNPLGARLAQAALDEYAEFNGHRIDAGGRLWKAGSVESEAELLYDPNTGKPAPDRPGRYAWRRVWEYWLTLERHVPEEALSHKVISVSGLLKNPSTAAAPDETRLSALLPAIQGEAPAATALRQAAVRAALNDSPWSAAFISYLADRVGLESRQFFYSSSHWEYIAPAFRGQAGYAFAACDPRATPPRVGDLLCYARGASPFKNYAEWREAVRRPGFSTPSHCEVVTDVDLDAKKIETVGGNVLQSVVRRKLKLNRENVLSDANLPKRGGTGRECRRDPSCGQDNLNVQYWAVLLKLR